MELLFDQQKQWKLPKPTGDRVVRPQFNRVTQTKFLNEYYPSGHKIFDRSWYQDIADETKKGNFLGLL